MTAADPLDVAHIAERLKERMGDVFPPEEYAAWAWRLADHLARDVVLPMLAQARAAALEDAAADIYNADPDPAFPQRQTFYNEGVNPWLMARALRERYGQEKP